MRKLYTRALILGLFLLLASVAFLQEAYLISCYFSAMFGLLLGIIAMKEKDNLRLFALSHGADVDEEV